MRSVQTSLFVPSCTDTRLHSSLTLMQQVLPASLRHLDISGNTLTDLHGIEELTCLTWLDASSNALQVVLFAGKVAFKLQYCPHHTIASMLTLLLQSAAQLNACSQLCVLSLAQNQLTSLDGVEGASHTAPFAVCAVLYVLHSSFPCLFPIICSLQVQQAARP